MSYCRFGDDSDVYLFCGSKYEMHVSRTSNSAPESYIFDTPDEVLNKLLDLRDEGVKIPDYALKRLQYEVNAN